MHARIVGGAVALLSVVGLMFVIDATTTTALAAASGDRAFTPIPSSKYDKCVPVTAHRGSGPGTVRRGGRLLSEDTIPAFKMAYHVGADGFETDYQLTRDKQLVSLHDPDVARMTGFRGRVGSMLARRVTRLHTPSGARIPLQWTVLKAMGRYHGIQQQELKPNGYPVAVRIKMLAADIKWLGDSVTAALFTASERRTLVAFQQTALDKFGLDIQTGLIMRSPRARFDLTKVSSKVADYLMLDNRAIDRDYVKRAHHRGFGISARTVNTQAVYRRMVKIGVDRVVTDRPWAVHSNC